MAVTPEATAGGTRPGQRQQTAAGPQQHAADVEAAFSLSCARRWAECDRTCSVALTAVNALCLPARLRQGPPLRAAAVAAALHAALALPGLLAWLARGWYLPRRTAVVTACLLASWVLVEAPQPATLSQAHYLPLLWPKFLAVSQCLGLSLLTMSFRLPFQARAGGHASTARHATLQGWGSASVAGRGGLPAWHCGHTVGGTRCHHPPPLPPNSAPTPPAPPCCLPAGLPLGPAGGRRHQRLASGRHALPLPRLLLLRRPAQLRRRRAPGDRVVGRAVAAGRPAAP